MRDASVVYAGLPCPHPRKRPLFLGPIVWVWCEVCRRDVVPPRLWGRRGR